jgi:hypothetical protein
MRAGGPRCIGRANRCTARATTPPPRGDVHLSALQTSPSRRPIVLFSVQPSSPKETHRRLPQLGDCSRHCPFRACNPSPASSTRCSALDGMLPARVNLPPTAATGPPRCNWADALRTRPIGVSAAASAAAHGPPSAANPPVAFDTKSSSGATGRPHPTFRRPRPSLPSMYEANQDLRSRKRQLRSGDVACRAKLLARATPGSTSYFSGSTAPISIPVAAFLVRRLPRLPRLRSVYFYCRISSFKCSGNISIAAPQSSTALHHFSIVAPHTSIAARNTWHVPGIQA